MREFENQVALVTGAGSGIGLATALAFVREGAKVVVADVDAKAAAETARQIESAGGDALPMQTDVSKPDDCAAMVARTLTQFGRLDCACNNAGIAGTLVPLAEQSIENWHRVIGVNLSGVFYCMKEEIPAMLRGGGGTIVNMSSILGSVGFAGASAYTATKHGVVGLTKNAALEYGKQNIRVNAIGPGFIRTPMIAGMEDAALPLHPIGRLGLAEEVAELVLFLTSRRSTFVTGAYYPIDGGFLAQ